MHVSSAKATRSRDDRTFSSSSLRVSRKRLDVILIRQLVDVEIDASPDEAAFNRTCPVS